MPNNLDKLFICFVEEAQRANISLNEYTNTTLHPVNVNTFPAAQKFSSSLHIIELIFSALSFIVSTVNLVIFTRPAMLNLPINFLFVSLEVASLIVAALTMYVSAMLITYGSFTTHIQVFYFKLVVNSADIIASFFIVWSTAAISVWRLVAVTQPLKAVFLLTRRTAVVTITALVLTSGVPAIVIACTQVVVKNVIPICTDLHKKNITLVTYYDALYSSTSTSYMEKLPPVLITLYIGFYVLPVICFAVVTAFLVYYVCVSKRKKKTLCEGQVERRADKEQLKTSIVLISFLWGFLLANVLPCCFNVLLSIMCNPTELCGMSYLVITVDNNLLSVVANSFSIFAYYLTSVKFREIFHSFLNKVVLRLFLR